MQRIENELKVKKEILDQTKRRLEKEESDKLSDYYSNERLKEEIKIKEKEF